MNNILLNISNIFPKNVTVVFIHAHADDESFLSAGTINYLQKNGRKCILIYAAAEEVEGQKKTLIRKKEIASVSTILNIHKIFYLPFCEPQYQGSNALPFINQETETVLSELYKIITDNKIQTPFVLVSYDKNGGYGNKDHVLLHKVGREYIEKNRNKVLNFLEVTLNRNRILDWINDSKDRLGTESLPQLSYWSKEFGLSESEISFFYELNKIELEKKYECFKTHKSQIHTNEFPASLSMNDFEQVFGREYYKIYKSDSSI